MGRGVRRQHTQRDFLHLPDESKDNKKREPACRALLLGPDQAQEHVEGDLDRVDEDEAVLGADELEVDGVHNGPYLPRALASREQIVLDLVGDDAKGISVDESEVGEKDSHEDGAPDELIKRDFGSDVLGLCSFNLFVQPVVKVVS